MMATPGSPDAVLKDVHPCQPVKRRRRRTWKTSSSAARMCPRGVRVGGVGVDVDVDAVVVAGIGVRWIVRGRSWRRGVRSVEHVSSRHA